MFTLRDSRLISSSQSIESLTPLASDSSCLSDSVFELISEIRLFELSVKISSTFDGEIERMGNLRHEMHPARNFVTASRGRNA